MPEALHLLHTAYDENHELIESFPAIAIVLCMKGEPELCKWLKTQLVPSIPLYSSVMQERKYECYPGDQQEIPTWSECIALLIKGTIYWHLVQEDPEPHHFRTLAKVWAWAMIQTVRCIQEARGEDDDSVSGYPLYSVYNVRGDLPKVAPLHDSSPIKYKVVYLILSIISKQMNCNDEWSFLSADMAWSNARCEQYEQSGFLISWFTVYVLI